MTGSASIQGMRSATDFVKTNSSRWAEAELTVHETTIDGKKVVLVWSFQARNVGPIPGRGPATNEVHGWGGISLFRFDDSGKTKAEKGEERRPSRPDRPRSARQAPIGCAWRISILPNISPSQTALAVCFTRDAGRVLRD